VFFLFSFHATKSDLLQSESDENTVTIILSPKKKN
jgi:hypothetical protein